jgi:hypothetical protein
MSTQDHHNTKQTKQSLHETTHEQSLLLGLAFMAIWAPNNLMAPNLTQMADDFHMTEAERDFCTSEVIVPCLGRGSLFSSSTRTDWIHGGHLFSKTRVWCGLCSFWTRCFHVNWIITNIHTTLLGMLDQLVSGPFLIVTCVDMVDCQIRDLSQMEVVKSHQFSSVAR